MPFRGQQACGACRGRTEPSIREQDERLRLASKGDIRGDLPEDLHVLLRLAAERLQAAAEARSVVIFTRAPRDQVFWATAQAGITDEILGRLKFEVGSRILDFLGAAVDPGDKDLPEHERLKLQKTKIDLILPMKLKGELMGFVGLGNKVTGDAYDSLDFKFLSSVTGQIGAAMEYCACAGRSASLRRPEKSSGDCCRRRYHRSAATKSSAHGSRPARSEEITSTS